jgi:hypothetical protein
MRGMWEKSIQVYRDQGCSASVVEFKMYEGLGHSPFFGATDTDIGPQVKGVIAFFKKHIK